MRLLRGHDERALRTWPVLLLPAELDTGRLLAAVRLFSPKAREKTGKIIVYGHIVLHGPIELTPELTAGAQLPGGMAFAYYAGVQDQTDSAQRDRAGRLLRGLAVRLGGTVHPAGLCAPLGLTLSVYSEHAAPAEQAIRLLSPWARLTVSDPDHNGYALFGDDAPFFVTCLTARLWKVTGLAGEQPLALGELRERPLHQWDVVCPALAAGADDDVVRQAGEAALALARGVRGVAIDMYGFPVSQALDPLGH